MKAISASIIVYCGTSLLIAAVNTIPSGNGLLLISGGILGLTGLGGWAWCITKDDR
jgi:hypothetical protein